MKVTLIRNSSRASITWNSREDFFSKFRTAPTLNLFLVRVGPISNTERSVTFSRKKETSSRIPKQQPIQHGTHQNDKEISSFGARNKEVIVAELNTFGFLLNYLNELQSQITAIEEETARMFERSTNNYVFVGGEGGAAGELAREIIFTQRRSINSLIFFG